VSLQASSQKDESFWKDFASMADFFSPALTPLQRYVGLGSKELFYSLGDAFGRKVAEKLDGGTLREVLSSLSELWERMEIGRFEVVHSDPLTLLITNCRVCGQLPGTGNMYECAFHQGLFESVISNTIGEKVSLRQDTNFEGEAGTWCRRFVADVKI
jgi:predicted hydrocarbon binding protein